MSTPWGRGMASGRFRAVDFPERVRRTENELEVQIGAMSVSRRVVHCQDPWPFGMLWRRLSHGTIP